MATLDQLLRAVAEARDALLKTVAPLDGGQGAFKPSPAEWSVAEILEHLYLAELSGITKLWSASNDLRAGRRWTGPLPHRGKSMDDVVRDTWKLREIAPPSAAPHFGGPLQAWSAALRTLSPMLRDLATELRGQNLEDIVFPHFLSGPLDARQRLEFLAFHLRRHHAQVQRVVASPGFPGSSRP